MLVPATITVSLAVYVAAPLIVRIVLGPQFAPSEAVLRILVALLPVAALTLLLGVQWMVPLGLEKAFTKITVTTAVVNCLLAAILARRFGQLGVSWAVVSSEVIAVMACLTYLSRAGLNPFLRLGIKHQQGDGWAAVEQV